VGGLGPRELRPELGCAAPAAAAALPAHRPGPLAPCPAPPLALAWPLASPCPFLSPLVCPLHLSPSRLAALLRLPALPPPPPPGARPAAEEGLDAYWAQLQDLTTKDAAKSFTQHMPGRAVPELQSRSAWISSRLMPLHQWLALLARLDAHRADSDWSHCKSISDDLGLDYAQVSGGRGQGWGAAVGVGSVRGGGRRGRAGPGRQLSQVHVVFWGGLDRRLALRPWCCACSWAHTCPRTAGRQTVSSWLGRWGPNLARPDLI
jgi:hypothetical protein